MNENYDAKPLMEFDSHVAGKNAKVQLYPDRVEWSKAGWMGTVGKVALGTVTAGASLLATGVRGSRSENMVMVRSISSVTSKKSGLAKTEVQIHTPAGLVSFRCSGGEAKRFKELLLQQLRHA